MPYSPTDVPTGFDSDGTQKIWMVLKADLVDPTAISAALLNGADAQDMSCYLTADFAPTATQATIEDNRVCLRQPLESPGAITWTIETMEYIFDVQNPASDSNKVYALAVEGAEVYLISRYGMDASEDAALGDVVDVYPAKLGARIKLPATRNTKGRVTQKPFIDGPRIEDTVLVA